MKVGDVVRILKPNYAKGLLGTIEAFESEYNRWIIKLKKNSFKNNEERSIRLSLPESDFEVIKFL